VNALVVLTKPRHHVCVCEARTENEILLVFSEPDGIDLRPGDQLDLGPLALNDPVPARKVHTGQDFEITLRPENVHDLRLPMQHGVSRTPSPERLSGA
jgi:hypothetical protein